MSNDPELGKKIQQRLANLNLETPMKADFDKDESLIGASFLDVLQDGLGMDMNDDSIVDTPNRIARMYCHEIFTGMNYDNFPKCTVVENKMRYDEVVISDKMQVLSVCEHHFVPFVGFAYFGYIPHKSVIGLSKINRVVNFFARRPQVQERLTEQIASALVYILGTENIGLVIKCEHMCVRLRGIQDSNTQTVTSKMMGRFRESEALRMEFFSLTRVNQS